MRFERYKSVLPQAAGIYVVQESLERDLAHLPYSVIPTKDRKVLVDSIEGDIYTKLREIMGTKFPGDMPDDVALKWLKEESSYFTITLK
jgi:hypothetical protein